jgi:hypothetical protein
MLRMRYLVLIVVIVGVLGTTTTSASAKVIVCTRHTLALWEFKELSTCWRGFPEVTFGKWERSGLKAGEKRTLTSHGGPFTLSATVAGVKISIECGKEKDTGELLGTEPTTGTTSMEFTSCTAGASSVKEPIKIESAKIEEITEGEKLFYGISPASGTVFTTIVLKGCAGEGTYELIGTARSEIGLEETTFGAGTGSKLELKKGASAGVATFVGKEAEEMEATEEEVEETRFQVE